jgi:hypothetical protein
MGEHVKMDFTHARLEGVAWVNVEGVVDCGSLLRTQ